MNCEEQQVRTAIARLERLEAQTKAARADVATAVNAALDAGMKQVQLVRITGYSREHIRRIALRENDVPRVSG